MKKLIAFVLIFSFINIQTCFAQKEVLIRLNESITSENITSGDIIKAELVSGVTDNGCIFKKGTTVNLLPKEVKKRGFGGRGGYIEIRKGLISDTNGNEHTITLNQKAQGDNKDWVMACIGVFTMTLILIPLDLIGLVKGGSARIDEGTVFEGLIEADLK